MVVFSVRTRFNETNPDVIRSLKFVEQANIMIEKKLVNKDQLKILHEIIPKMISTVHKRYELDERKDGNSEGEKLIESFKTTHQLSMENLERKLIISNLSKQLSEAKLEEQKKLNDLKVLTNSLQRIKMECQLESEKNENNIFLASKNCSELEKTNELIRENLEQSNQVNAVRKIEKEKKDLEEKVESLRKQDEQLSKRLSVLKATLKSESQKPFQKVVVEAAKNYHCYSLLSPKLVVSKRNVEKLKAEEMARKISGSLDETVLFENFDNSFVQASLNNEKESTETQEKLTEIETEKNPAAMNMTRKNESESSGKEISIENDSSKEQQQNDDSQAEEVAESQRCHQITVENEADDENKKRIENEEKENEIEEIENNKSGEENDEQNTSADILIDDEHDEVDDNFVIKKSNEKIEKKKSPAEAIIDISMSSQDAGSDLLKEIEGRISEDDDLMSDGSTDNFSFNLFGAISGETNASTNNSTKNFDFNFGTSSTAENNNFDLFGGGDGVDNATDNADPFGFGKSDGPDENAAESSFSFNFDSAHTAGSGGASFFNF